jgi:ribokinase
MITVIGDLILDILVRQDTVNYATDAEGSIDICAGGQGNNVAAWISACGVQSHLIGRVGNDAFGMYLIKEAGRHGVRCSVALDASKKTGMILIVVDATGERTMIVDRGANLHLSEKDIQGVEESQLLYISGYSLYAEGPRRAAECAKHQAQKLGIPIAVDPSSLYHLRTKKLALLSFLDVTTFLFPNYEEGKLLTGEEEPARILESLQQWVPCPVLKLGDKGCMLSVDGTIVHVPASPITPVDSTGAGDAFAGAFLATYLRTKNVLAAAKRATKVSTQIVGRLGARPGLEQDSWSRGIRSSE